MAGLLEGRFALVWSAGDFQAVCMSQKAKIIILLIFFDHFWVIATSVKVAEVTSKLDFEGFRPNGRFS